MAEKVLLLLGIADAEEAGIYIKKESHRRDVRVRGEGRQHEENAVEEAFNYARSKSRSVVAVQVLYSDLYHYGHTDLLLPGPGKKRFLLYVRDEVLKQAMGREKALRERARRQGIALEVRSVESQDPASTAVEEAKKGYDAIFLPKERKRRFPLLKRNVEQQLRKQVLTPIISC
jgi:nucleotide-binding universal stress UspA family protein